jgi:phosphatidylserine decarboxylase
VHPPFQRPEFPVFTLNERVIMEYETEGGRCILVMVAGWGVGHITHPFPLPLRRRRGRVSHHRLAPPRTFRAGEWLATFELGSTVILIIEPRPGRRALPGVGSSVRIGSPVFDIVPGA